MKDRVVHKVTIAAVLLAAGVGAGLLLERRSPSAKATIPCTGEYADSLQWQSARMQELEQGPRSKYSYLVRSSARYECPYFGPDGKLRRKRIDTVEHGTAFAYEMVAGETYLLTNEHVAVWPEVTDARNRVDGVAEGCKRVEERLRIVQDDQDNYEPGQIPLVRVAADPLLDAAILKAPQPLVLMPHKLGKSAALRQGNAVQVRGFPLGLIHAVNTGKIVNPYDRDVEQGWDHVDFVIDALLSEGNSGSPVLALSCKTGEFQLVGMYHAGYKGASALNVVVGVDQLREFMAKKKRVARTTPDGPTLGAPERKRLVDRFAQGALPIVDFGGLFVQFEDVGDRIRYHVYGRGFPLDDRRIVVLEDHAAPDRFGEVTTLWVANDAGWRALDVAALGVDERDLVTRTVDGMRVHLGRALDYRRGLRPDATPDDRRRGREVSRLIERHAAAMRELTAGLTDLTERLGAGRDVAAGSAGPDAGAPPPPPPLRAERL